MTWFTIDTLLRDLPYCSADPLLNNVVVQTPRGLRGDQSLTSRELSAVFLAKFPSPLFRNYILTEIAVTAESKRGRRFEDKLTGECGYPLVGASKIL